MMAGKINEKVSSIEAQNSSLKRNLEEMRIHIGQLNQQLEQEQNAVKQLRREKALEIKQVKEHEEQTSKVTINDLKAKLLNDKEKELANQREQLNRQHNTEINRISRVNDEAFKKYQLKSQKEKEEEFSRKKHELLADLKLNITRSFKAEKAKLLQEIDDLKKSKKHLDEELNLLVISDRQKATDIRRSYEEHLRELDQIRKEAKTDMRRLIDELKSKDRVIGDLEKELGYQSSYSQRLQLEKDSLGSLLNLTKMAESWEKRSPRAAMKKSRSLDLDNLTNEDSDKERRLQLRLTELNNTVRRLEDRNKQLMEGKSMESQLEQNPEKNKVLSKRLNDMEQSNKRLEEKSRLLELENKRLRTLKDQMRSRLERENKHLKKALNEEHASLKEEVSEVELLRAKLEQQARVIDRLKNNNNTDLLSIDRKAVKSVSDEVSLVSDSGTIDEDDWNEFDKAELEANYQQLSKECLQLQKAYTQLQTVVGGTLDTQREAKIRRELESDLIESQATIESLQQLLIDSGRSVDWLKEKQKMQKQITKSNEKLHELEYSLKEVKDEKELLEFQLLETSEQDFSICSTDSPRASTPRILITQHPRTEEAGLHYACTLDQFNEIMYSELRQRLQALNSNKDFVVSKADSELLNQTLKMLDIADMRLVSMDEEMASLRKVITELEIERNNLATDNMNMSTELVNQTLEGQNTQEKVTELEQALEQFKNSETKLDLVEGAFKRTEERLEKENKKLKKQLSDANEGRFSENEMLQQKVNENRQLANRVTELERELAVRERHLNKTERQRLISMEKETTQHKKTIKNLQDFLMEHETKSAEIQEEKTLLEDENKELVQEISHLKMKTAQSITENSKLQEQLQKLKLEKNSLETTIIVDKQEHLKRFNELQSKITNMEETIKRLVEENKDLVCKTKYFEDNDMTVDKYNKLLEEVERLRNNETDQQFQIKKLEEKLNQLENKEVESTDEDTSCSLSLPIDNSHLNHEKGDNEKSEKELKEKLDEFETSERELKNEIKKLKSSDETLKMTLSQLISENSILQHEKSQARSEVEELKEEEVMLKKVIKDQITENGKLINNQDSAVDSSNIDVAKDTLMKELTDMKASDCMLKEQVHDLMQKNDKLTAERSDMSRQLKEFLSVESRLHDEISGLQTTVMELRESNKSVNNHIDENEIMLKDIQVLEDIKLQLESKVKLLEEDKDELEGKLQDFETLVRDAGIANTEELENSNKILSDKLQELQEQHNMLQTEVKDLKENENTFRLKLDELQESEQSLLEKISTENEDNNRLTDELDELREQIASLEEIRGNLKEKLQESEEQIEELKMTSMSVCNDNLEGTAKSLQGDLCGSFDDGTKNDIIEELQLQMNELKEENERLHHELKNKMKVKEEVIGEESLIDFSTPPPPPLPKTPSPLPTSATPVFPASQTLLQASKKEAVIWQELEKVGFPGNPSIYYTNSANQIGDKLKLKEEECKDLLDKIANQEIAIKKFQTDLQRTEEKLAETEEMLLEKTNDIEDLEKAVAQSGRRCSVSDIQNRDLEEELQKSNLELEDFKLSIIEMEENEEVLMSRIKELENQSRDLRDQNVLLKDQVTSLESVEKDLKIALTNLEQENATVFQRVADMKKMEEQLNEKIKEVETNSKLVDTLTNEIKELKQHLKDLTTTHSSQIQKLEEATNMYEECKHKLQILENETTEEREILVNKIKELKNEELELLKKVQTLESVQLKTKNDQDNIQILTKKLHEIQEEMSKSQDQIKDSENYCKQLENRVAEHEKHENEFMEKNEALLSECNNLKAQIKELLKEEKTDLVSENAEIEEEIVQQATYQETATEPPEEHKNMVSSLEEKIRELEEEKQEMQQRLFEHEEKENAFKETLSQADAIMNERESSLREHINELETSQSDLKERLEAARTNSEDRASDDWHDALDDREVLEETKELSKDEEIRHLQQRIVELEETELQLKLELKNMDQGIDTSNMNNYQNNETIKLQIDRISELEEIEINLLEELEQAKTTQKALTEANEELLDEVAVLKTTVDDLESLAENNAYYPPVETSSHDIEKLQEELESVILQLQDLEETDEKLREDLKGKENEIKELKKSNLQLQEDVDNYSSHLKDLEDSEKKLKDLLNEKEKSGDTLKSNYTELEEKISDLEATDLFLTEKLNEKNESENILKKELISAEERLKRSEISLKESEELLKKQMREKEDLDKELHNHVTVMADSEEDLKKKVLKLELVTVNAVQQIEQLENSNEKLNSKALSSEEAEKLMRIDFNQMKHENDLLNEQMIAAKKAEKNLRERLSEVESVESQLRTQVWKLERGEAKHKDRILELEEKNSSMERKSNQAIELEQELLHLQNELQEVNKKQDDLQRSKDEIQGKYNTLHNSLETGNTVSIPENEYQQLKTQVMLLSFDDQEKPQTVAKLPDLLHQLSHRYSCKFINDFVLQNTPTTGHKSLKDALESVSQDNYPIQLTDASIGHFYVLYRLQALEDMFDDMEEPLNATRLHNTPGHSHIIFDENDQPVEIHCALCARKKMEQKKRAAEQWLATVARETHPTNMIQREIVNQDSYSSLEENTPLQQASPNTRRKLIEDLVNALPLITVEESINEQSVDGGSMIMEDPINEIRIDDKLEAPPMPSEPPPLPGSAPPSHNRVNSTSSEFSDNAPPLPQSAPPLSRNLLIGNEAPPSNGSTRPINGLDESDGIQRPRSLFMRPLSFDSGTETLSTTTVEQDSDHNPVGRAFSLPQGLPRGKRETPELAPKPPTPLWLKKMMEWQSQEKEKDINEAQRMKTQNTILQSKIDEKDNLIQEIRKREEELKRKLRDMEHISISRQKIQAKELDLEDKNFEIARLKSENWQKEREIATLQSKIEELKRLNGNYSNEDGILKKLRDELDLTKNHLRVKENQLQNFEFDDSNFKDNLQRTNKQMKEKEEELKKKTDELQNLKDKLDKLEEEVSATRGNDATHFQQMIDNLQREKIQMENEVAKLPEMVETIEALKEEQRNMDLALREKDAVDRKLQLAENMLKDKTSQEMYLADENASLQEKVNHLEKLSKYKDNIEEHYQDIKDKFDRMEEQKNEAELSICPLKAKVSYLREKCKERDLMIKKMSRVLQAHVDSNVSGKLLSEITEVQTLIPAEEYNQPLPLPSQLKKSPKKDYLPKGNSAATFSPLSQRSFSSDGLDKTSKLLRSRSPVLSGLQSQSLHNGLDELDMTQGISVADLLQKTSKPQTKFTARSDSMEDLFDSLQTLSENIRGRSDSHSRDTKRAPSLERSFDWLSPSSPSGADILSRTKHRRSKPSVYLDSSPERIVQMHQELQDAHVNQYKVPYQSSIDPVFSSGVTTNIPDHRKLQQNGVMSATSTNYLSGPTTSTQMNGHSNGLLIVGPSLNNTLYQSIHHHSPSHLHRLPGENSTPVITHNGIVLPHSVGLLNTGQLNMSDLSNGLPQRVLSEPHIKPFPHTQPRHLQLNHTNVTKAPTVNGVDAPDLPGLKRASNGHIRPETKHGEPPDPPTHFTVAKQLGKHGVLLTWVPPVMDSNYCSNGSHVNGYKLFVNGQQRQFVANATLKKALVDGVDLTTSVTFGIQTMSEVGLHSRIVHSKYNHILAVPYTTPQSQSAATESFQDVTTDSSVFSDDQEQRLFIAVYEYIPEKHSPNDYPAYELAFEEGDILTIYGQKRQDGFFQGKVRGKRGLVPSNFIEEISMSTKHHSKSKRSQNKISERTRPSRHSRKTLPVPHQKEAAVSKPKKYQDNNRSSYKQR